VTVRILRKAEYRAMPWKNGGGTTYEVAAFPENDRSLDTFEWRISMAQVETDGPFSNFPDVDRSLGILAGDGLTLRFANQNDITVRHNTSPVRFPADVPVAATLLAGPVLDLNVMTRRNIWSHRVSLCGADIDARLDERTCLRMLIAPDSNLVVHDEDGKRELLPGDAVMFDRATSQLTLATDLDARMFQIDLWRVDELAVVK
jgi:environmental stress-induced protein Ves